MKGNLDNILNFKAWRPDFRKIRRTKINMVVMTSLWAMCFTLGWYAHVFWHVDHWHSKQQSLIVAGTSGPVSEMRSKACPHWDSAVQVQRQIQRDYCLRHFTGAPPRSDTMKTQLAGPYRASSLEFMVYESADVISKYVRETHEWERSLCDQLVLAMETVAERWGLLKNDRSQLSFLDVGGNMGVHTIYVQAAGFSVVTFESLPQNEDIIRSNLCMNDAAQERVTFFTKGLGNVAALCKEYSTPNYNRGNGVVSCDGSIPQHADGAVSFKGQMEIVRLDDLWRCAELEKGGHNYDNDGISNTGNGESGLNDSIRDSENGIDRINSLLPQIPIGAMKMDVEGFEYNVVTGALHFLRATKIPFIVLEVGRMAPGNRQQVLAFFYSLGYEAGVDGFFQNLGRPLDLPDAEEAFLVLEEELWG